METERDNSLYSERLASLLTELGTTLNAPIDSERLSKYVELLSDLAEPRIKFACTEIAKSWKYSRYPQIGELRDVAFRWIAPTEARPAAIVREDKPADWEAIGGRAGFSKAEIADMLEAGKESQREYIAKLEADPEWRRMAARFGGKVSTSDDLAGLRNGKSDIPEDPEERKSWARERGEKWL